MSQGIPVRLSADLTARARTAASAQERSLTEQVEHWARLGQVVEEAILGATARRLKARSHDPQLSARVKASLTSEGRARARDLIRGRDLVRHGIGDDGAIKVVREPAPSKKRR